MAVQRKSSKAPKVVDLVQQLDKLRLQCRWTFPVLRDLLNERLPVHHLIPSGRTGTEHVQRWLHPEWDSWVEPRGEVVIAMQNLLVDELRSR